MELRKFSIERYKCYAELAKVELAPLTILVGPNNSGKTALAQAIQLLTGGLAPSGKDTSEPLPLESGGIHHGETFEDLVTGRTAHGWLRLSAVLADDRQRIITLGHRSECGSAAPAIRAPDFALEPQAWRVMRSW